MACPLCYFLLPSSQTSCLFPCQRCEDTCLDWQIASTFQSSGEEEEHEPGPASARPCSMGTFLLYNLSPSWVVAPWAKRPACWVSTWSSDLCSRCRPQLERRLLLDIPSYYCFSKNSDKNSSGLPSLTHLLRKKYIFFKYQGWALLF